MLGLMRNADIGLSIVALRDSWSARGHNIQLEVMLKTDISFVDFDISRAQYIEYKAYHNLPLPCGFSRHAYERDYYSFLRTYLNGIA